MRVLHYARRIVLEEGGVVRAVLDMAAGMSRQGHEMVLATPEGPDVPVEWTGEGGTPRGVLLAGVRSRLDLLPGEALAVLREEMRACDVVHLHGPWVTSNLQAARLARESGKPYVVSTHGVFNEWALAHRGWKKKLYLSAFGRRFLEGAGAVHCTAEAELEAARGSFPRGRGVVAPLLFDASPYVELPGPGLAAERFPELAGAGPVVLFLGRVAPIKRVELLVEAFAEVARVADGSRLVIAGVFEDEGYQKDLAGLAGRLGVLDRTTFAGHVGGELKVSLYELASVMVLPSFQENFGIVLFESLACGTPVVATRGVNSWRLLEGCPAARIVEAEAGAMAGGIVEAGGCGSGDSGRAWVLETMGEARLCGEYEKMYRGAGERERVG